jgi:hypothetical protein
MLFLVKNSLMKKEVQFATVRAEFFTYFQAGGSHIKGISEKISNIFGSSYSVTGGS